MFVGNITGLDAGDYDVEIDIEDEERILTVVRNATSFSIGGDDSLIGPIDPLLISGIIIIPVLAIVVYVVMKKR